MVTQEYLNLKETAKYFGMGYSTVREQYLHWAQYGVIPSRRPGSREIRFKRSDLDLLHERTKVIETKGGRYVPDR
jgi:excisionase family DNA binding protein